MQIEDALESCDYVLILLSRHSIEKTGFVQVEKRHILDRLDQMPEGSIFLIPVRLEDCSPRNKHIQRLHRVDLFPSWDAGVQEIARALQCPKQEIQRAEDEKREAAAGSATLSVRDYFEVVLPTMLRWKGNEATKLNKRIRFVLSDQRGESWTLNLVPPVATVVANDQSKVDLSIQLTSKCMQAILEGQFDARKAIADGDVELFGDLTLLKAVGVLFASRTEPPG